MIFIKKYKPTSPGIRKRIGIFEKNLYKGKPLKSLINKKISSSGRNNSGKITSYNRGGGHKRNYRIIDWKRKKDNIKARVERIEYDPNRGPYIALLIYSDGEKRYVIYPKLLEIGSTVISGNNVSISIGNCLPLKSIPVGINVHCIELVPGKGAQLSRGAGCYSQLLSKEGKYAILRLSSGEVRKVLADCRATVGEVCKSEHNLQVIGKAGRNRWKNKRPRVRGVAMNPVDHPLGGGEGKSSGGRPSCSPWGIPDGTKTRKRKKFSNNLIIKHRK